MNPGFGIYVHWPFCESKCPYCDFNSHVAEAVDHDSYAEALCRELNYFRAASDPQIVTSVFFGGGTPSLMRPATVGKILDAIQRDFTIANDLEVTLEANPGSVEAAKFRDFHAAGVNRVSIGVQSLEESSLKFLGRKHSSTEAIHAIDTARGIFNRYSFDLIYARPQQTATEWERELRAALQHAGNHLSLYQLTIEQGTPFFSFHKSGKFIMPEDHLQADLYQLTNDIMADAGLPAYEISNYARTGEECRHNLTYWRYGNYLGVGPGAHGRITQDGKKIATRTHRAPEIWLKRVHESGHATQDKIELSKEDQFEERLMMGLRLTEGIPFPPLEQFLPPKKLQHMIAHEFLEIQNNYLRATDKGRLCLNGVLEQLIA